MNDVKPQVGFFALKPRLTVFHKPSLELQTCYLKYKTVVSKITACECIDKITRKLVSLLEIKRSKKEREFVDMTITRRYHAEKASDYDVFASCITYHDKFQTAIGAVLEKRLDRIRKPQILEIACGTGFTTEKIVAAVPDATITAVDIDPDMLLLAKQRVNGQSVHFYEEDVFETIGAHATGRFDAVVSGYFAHNFPAPERAQLFREIGRIVKVGGAIVIGDKITRDGIRENWWDLKAGIACLEKFRRTEYAHLEELWIEHYLDDHAIRLTESEQRELFRTAGCDDVTLFMRYGFDAVMSGIRVNA